MTTPTSTPQAKTALAMLRETHQDTRADQGLLHPGGTVEVDNFMLKIRGEVDLERFRLAREQLEDPEFWANDAMWQAITASLPNYRLRKFQPRMPWVEREVVADDLLDVGGALRWMADTPKPGL
jgi:hypothetical protein